LTKKLTWEVDKASLVLKVTDGAKETTWKIRKSTKTEDLRTILEEMQLALWEPGGPNSWGPIEPTVPMLEAVRTVDAEELAELQRYKAVQASSEEASRAAQAAYVDKLNIGAKWFEADEDETYGIPIPDYDTGEVRPR
jgi:hypothetical protein